MKNLFDHNALAFSTTSLATGLMGGIFHFYYVRLFMDRYHISEPWFHTSQIIYMIWNAINDPLFAYWQDNSSIEIFRSRRHAIMYGAPLFALCFLLPWFPWKHYESHDWLIGVHLTVSLCCYDALFTFVMLSHCALYAEISKQPEDRLRLVRYTQIASILGSTSVLISEFVSDNLKNFHAFQMWCMVVAFISWAAMHYTGRNVRTRFEIQLNSVKVADEQLCLEKESSEESEHTSAISRSLTQSKQIMSNKNFIIFVFTNFFQIFHREYGSNFLSLFVTRLIPESDLSISRRKIMFGSTFIFTKFVVLFLSIFVARHGYYRVMTWSFYFKIISAALMFVIGAHHTHILVIFFVLDRSLPAAIVNISNLSVSDIIDEDQQIYARERPLSSMVFGYNALFTKPAQSLAPMLVVFVLNKYGYQRLQDENLSLQDTIQLHNIMFYITCFTPFIIGTLQLLVWSNYSIRNSHITVTKHVE